MDFELWSASAPYRTLIMVSKHLHCLNDLLFRTSTGALQIEVPAVVSNHPDAEPLVRSYGIDFHHVPVTPETKPQAEARLLGLVDDLGIDLVVLARYMQVLSDDRATSSRGRRSTSTTRSCRASRARSPTTPAYERGVKLVGATAHYVTGDARRGPDHRAGRRPGRPRSNPSSSSPPAVTSRPGCARLGQRPSARQPHASSATGMPGASCSAADSRARRLLSPSCDHRERRWNRQSRSLLRGSPCA